MGRTRKPAAEWDPKTEPLAEPRHEKFCIAYVKGLGEPNATAKQAAIDAGYPPKTAANAAYKLLKIQTVERRIRGLLQAQGESELMPIEERKARLSKIGRGKACDVYEALDKDGGRHRLRSRMLKTSLDAIQELNKLDGSYAPSKVSILDGSVFEIVIKGPDGKEVKLDKGGGGA